ncbi:MAG: Protein translocase subunit SecD [Candidatus Bipolaricaulis sibiricus]|uniref:Protein translocase subunit SecD n=1 Tax=Bipolaricaulis sibiricus TaxID=2501609 RepID=A0A410FUR8_BIPS1|nr:MAG: Protein translocase subunit SecD [Candidatus Bipolaricaulis sibiricus]
MRRLDWIRFGSVIVALFASIGLLYPFLPFQEVIKLGLDLQGGVRLVIEAQVIDPETGQPVPLRESQMEPSRQEDAVNQLVTIFSERVDQYGMVNAEIRPLGRDRVEVRVPKVQNPEEARKLLGSTALLEFRKVIDVAPSWFDLEARRTLIQEILPNTDKTEWYLVEGEPLLTGDVLDNAVVRTSTDPRQPGFFIALTFNRDGAERFVDALRRLQVNDRLAVILDNVVYSAPQVSASIKQAAQQGWRAVQDSTTITGRFTLEEARLLSVVLRSGALPTQVAVIEEQTVGPTLGAEYVRRGMTALVVSFVLVLVFMVAYYRWLGLVADAALVMTMLLVFAALRAFGATLTLPGIAGLVLTIGMAVDANVVIFERIKEERRTGKAPKACIAAGFAKSLSAVLDANITTLIVAFILFLLGSGPVEGFGITLGLGIAASVFSALILSRLLLETTGLGEFIPARPVQDRA